MKYPEFFDAAPAIHTYDPLAKLLGTCEGGLMTYHYGDAVRLCGHSCPTVASAFLIARAALTTLYPNGPAERGNISISMPNPEDEGTTGVVAQVLTLITGAAGCNGFPGIGGHHVRRGLLTYADQPADSEAIRFRRLDTGQCVAAQANLDSVRPDPKIRPLLMPAFSGKLAPEAQQQFGEAWQERVRRLFIESADDPSVIRVDMLGVA